MLCRTPLHQNSTPPTPAQTASRSATRRDATNQQFSNSKNTKGKSKNCNNKSFS